MLNFKLLEKAATVSIYYMCIWFGVQSIAIKFF